MQFDKKMIRFVFVILLGISTTFARKDIRFKETELDYRSNVPFDDEETDTYSGETGFVTFDSSNKQFGDKSLPGIGSDFPQNNDFDQEVTPLSIKENDKEEDYGVDDRMVWDKLQDYDIFGPSKNDYYYYYDEEEENPTVEEEEYGEEEEPTISDDKDDELTNEIKNDATTVAISVDTTELDSGVKLDTEKKESTMKNKTEESTDSVDEEEVHPSIPTEAGDDKAEQGDTSEKTDIAEGENVPTYSTTSAASQPTEKVIVGDVSESEMTTTTSSRLTTTPEMNVFTNIVKTTTPTTTSKTQTQSPMTAPDKIEPDEFDIATQPNIDEGFNTEKLENSVIPTTTTNKFVVTKDTDILNTETSTTTYKISGNTDINMDVIPADVESTTRKGLSHVSITTSTKEIKDDNTSVDISKMSDSTTQTSTMAMDKGDKPEKITSTTDQITTSTKPQQTTTKLLRTNPQPKPEYSTTTETITNETRGEMNTPGVLPVTEVKGDDSSASTKSGEKDITVTQQPTKRGSTTEQQLISKLTKSAVVLPPIDSNEKITAKPTERKDDNRNKNDPSRTEPSMPVELTTKEMLPDASTSDQEQHDEITDFRAQRPQKAEFTTVVLIVCIISILILLSIIAVIIIIVRARLKKRGKYEITSDVDPDEAGTAANGEGASGMDRSADKKAVVTVQYNDSHA
uniref:mucin-5AC-like n=1 Tax=Styela clava TaxID=7725 RepID=UPI00193A170A|nr:mucin-5AC-like [Styela clava]